MAYKKKYPTAGQPTKMTPEVIQAIRNAADFGCNDREILAHLTIIGMPIARDTLYKYFERYPEFRKEIDDRQESPILRAKQNLNNAMLDPKNAELSLKYLERKRSKEFSTKVEVDNNIEVTNNALEKLGKIINGKGV